MKIVKLTTPWNHPYYPQTPHGKGIVNGFRFEVNNDCKECDYWFVWGNLSVEEEVTCPAENVIYIIDETHSLRTFNHNFLQQFSVVVNCHQPIRHPKIIEFHYLNPWYLKKSHDDLIGESHIEKTKNLSVIVSDLALLEGHRKRLGFVRKAVEHFKDKIDVYGRGFNYIEDKWHGIAEYKYSIAIENNVVKDYFTEKLFECYLSHTMPIYYGCPNVHDYFDASSIISINIDDFEGSVATIEEAIETNLHETRLPEIIKAKQQFLQEYHVFPALAKIINANQRFFSMEKRGVVKLFPEQVFAETRTTAGFNHDSRVYNTRAAKEIVPVLFRIVQPHSVVDVGCGIGTWLSVFKELGVKEVLGFDGDYVDHSQLYICENEFIATDLSKPLRTDKKFDLVISLEVAEHLPKTASDNFVKSLTELGDVILFSAAIPEQGGENHINEQWPEYWEEKFSKHNFKFFDILRDKVWNNDNVDFWYKQNMFLVAKDGALPNIKSGGSALNKVHPKLYEMKLQQLEGLISQNAYLNQQFETAQKKNDNLKLMQKKIYEGEIGLRTVVVILFRTLKHRFRKIFSH